MKFQPREMSSLEGDDIQGGHKGPDKVSDLQESCLELQYYEKDRKLFIFPLF